MLIIIFDERSVREYKAAGQDFSHLITQTPETAFEKYAYKTSIPLI